MPNVYRQFLDLMPRQDLQIGTVVDQQDGLFTVELPGGAIVRARGSAQPGQRVYVLGGAIQGGAPDMPLTDLEI